jgi:hypothetical protein
MRPIALQHSERDHDEQTNRKSRNSDVLLMFRDRC